MLFIPTIPGEYIEPSIALDCLSLLSKCAIWVLSKVGFNTYLMSSSEESSKQTYKWKYYDIFIAKEKTSKGNICLLTYYLIIIW